MLKVDFVFMGLRLDFDMDGEWSLLQKKEIFFSREFQRAYLTKN